MKLSIIPSRPICQHLQPLALLLDMVCTPSHSPAQCPSIPPHCSGAGSHGLAFKVPSATLPSCPLGYLDKLCVECVNESSHTWMTQYIQSFVYIVCTFIYSFFHSAHVSEIHPHCCTREHSLLSWLSSSLLYRQIRDGLRVPSLTDWVTSSLGLLGTSRYRHSCTKLRVDIHLHFSWVDPWGGIAGLQVGVRLTL